MAADTGASPTANAGVPIFKSPSGQIVAIKFDEHTRDVPNVVACNGRVTNWRTYECLTCGQNSIMHAIRPRQSFSNLQDYIEHCETVHPNDAVKFICRSCKREFATKEEFVLHSFKRPRSGYACKLCDYVHACVGGILGHFDAVHGDIKPQKCTRRDVYNHQKSSSPALAGPSNRSAPGIAKQSVRRQSAQSGPSPKFPCPYCRKQYSHLASMKRHVHDRHTQGYLCKLCKAGFTPLLELSRHIRKAKHTEAAPSEIPDVSSSEAPPSPSKVEDLEVPGSQLPGCCSLEDDKSASSESIAKSDFGMERGDKDIHPQIRSEPRQKAMKLEPSDDLVDQPNGLQAVIVEASVKKEDV